MTRCGINKQMVCGVALATVVCIGGAAEDRGALAPNGRVSTTQQTRISYRAERELRFETASDSVGINVPQNAPPCRQTAMLTTFGEDSEIVDALSRKLVGRGMVALGESVGPSVRKYTEASLDRMWKLAEGRRFANCISQCLALSPTEKPVGLRFTSDGWRSICSEVPDRSQTTLEFEQRSCGTSAQWRQVLVRQAQKGTGSWVICATLATWGPSRDLDYRMKVDHMPPVNPTIAENR